MARTRATQTSTTSSDGPVREPSTRPTMTKCTFGVGPGIRSANGPLARKFRFCRIQLGLRHRRNVGFWELRPLAGRRGSWDEHHTEIPVAVHSGSGGGGPNVRCHFRRWTAGRSRAPGRWLLPGNTRADGRSAEYRLCRHQHQLVHPPSPQRHARHGAGGKAPMACTRSDRCVTRESTTGFTHGGGQLGRRVGAYRFKPSADVYPRLYHFDGTDLVVDWIGRALNAAVWTSDIVTGEPRFRFSGPYGEFTQPLLAAPPQPRPLAGPIKAESRRNAPGEDCLMPVRTRLLRRSCEQARAIWTDDRGRPSESVTRT